MWRIADKTGRKERGVELVVVVVVIVVAVICVYMVLMLYFNHISTLIVGYTIDSIHQDRYSQVDDGWIDRGR